MLPTVLLLLVGLTLLAHGGAALLRVQRLAGRAGALGLRARVHAEGGVRRAAASAIPPLPASGIGVVVADGRPEPDARVTVRGRLLGAEWILLEGTARVGIGKLRAVRSTGRIHWRLDPVRRLAAVGGAVESPVRPGGAGIVDGAGAGGRPEGWPTSACAPHRTVVASLLPGGSLPAWRPSPPLGGPTPPEGLDRIPTLGLLGGRELMERAAIRPSGSVTPRPVSRFGRCDSTEDANWGAPGGRACGDRHVLVVSDGPLLVEGGGGQGVLAVAGDLTLRGHHFAGLVLAGGSLRLRDGARITGAARVAGPVVVGRGSAIRASGCALLRALRDPGVRRRLGRPLALPGGPWIRIP